MSREERRQYERMMKNMERGAALPPAARARAERNAARRAARREPATARGRFDLRFWLRAVLLALAIGFVALSVQWGEGMPRALYVGVAVGTVALLMIVGFRLVQRRAAARS